MGIARAFINYDIKRRILQDYFGFSVCTIMNINDWDEKILKRHKTDGTEKYIDIAKQYEQEFHDDVMGRLGVLEATYVTRATDWMDQIIAVIQVTVDQGFAYESEGSVLLDSLIRGCALWVPSNTGEPEWPSPWGSGRPMWDLAFITSTGAASVLQKFTGRTKADFYSGDFLAQPTPQGKRWAKCWIKSGAVNGWPGSLRKALGTFTARQLRLLCLLHKYDKRLRNDDDLMCGVLETEKLFMDFFQTIKRKQTEYEQKQGTDNHYAKWKPATFQLHQFLQESKDKVDAALRNDFDAATAMIILVKLIRATDDYLSESESVPRSVAVEVALYLTNILQIFGVSLPESSGISIDGAMNTYASGGVDDESSPLKEALPPILDVVAEFMTVAVNDNNDGKDLTKIIFDLPDKLLKVGVKLEAESDGKLPLRYVWKLVY
jgi:cysteinyl-tRNA synthetase